MSEEKELKDQRIPIMMSESELKAVDDWSFSNRIRSRGEAIRRLVQIGSILDGNKADLHKAMVGLLDQYQIILDKMDDVLETEENELSQKQLAMIQAVVQMTYPLSEITPILRMVTGLAANFSSNTDLSQTIEEAKKVEDAFTKGRKKLAQLRKIPKNQKDDKR